MLNELSVALVAANLGLTVIWHTYLPIFKAVSLTFMIFVTVSCVLVCSDLPRDNASNNAYAVGPIKVYDMHI